MLQEGVCCSCLHGHAPWWRGFHSAWRPPPPFCPAAVVPYLLLPCVPFPLPRRCGRRCCRAARRTRRWRCCAPPGTAERATDGGRRCSSRHDGLSALGSRGRIQQPTLSASRASECACAAGPGRPKPRVGRGRQAVNMGKGWDRPEHVRDPRFLTACLGTCTARG